MDWVREWIHLSYLVFGNHVALAAVFFLLAKFRQKANFFTSSLFLATFGPKKNSCRQKFIHFDQLSSI
jgi:hypothetical protein